MSGIMWKSFNLCFSKFKCFPTITLPPLPAIDIAEEEDQHQNFLATKSPTLYKNFNSLFDANYSDFSTSKSISFSSPTVAAAAANTEEDFLSSSSDFSDDDCVPDFTSAFASNRFFFSPGSSNSIVEPAEPHTPQDPGAVVSGGVAVQTDSPDPYSDFRKSMMEMIEARHFADVKPDWEFLNELLVCYLSLNPKHTHKFIVKAFADVVVSLVPPRPPPCEENGRKDLQRRRATSDLSI